MFIFYIVFEISGTLSRYTTNTSLNFVFFAKLRLLTMKQKGDLIDTFMKLMEKALSFFQQGEYLWKVYDEINSTEQ